MPPISNAINENKAKLEAEKIAEENKEKNINLLSCKVLVENLSDGSVKHHFVNNNNLTDDISYEVNDIYSKWDYEYKGITDKDFIVPYSKISYNTTDYYGYTEIPETNGQYIFDYNVPYYVMDTSDLSLPNGYSLENLYSVNDLKELEAKLDNSIYENKNDDEKMLTVCLFIANIDDYYMCFDATHLSKIEETTNKKDVFALRKCYYIPSIDNNTMALKLSSGYSAVEENQKGISEWDIMDNILNDCIEDITSLDITSRNDLRGNRVVIRNIGYYLTDDEYKYFLRNGISREEVLNLVDRLNGEKYRVRK